MRHGTLVLLFTCCACNGEPPVNDSPPVSGGDSGEEQPSVEPDLSAHERTSYAITQARWRWEDRDRYRQRAGFLSSYNYGDFDGDGKMDVMAAVGTGPQNPIDFTLPTDLFLDIDGADIDGNHLFSGGSPPTRHPRKLLVGDINGDGADDALIIDHGYDAEPFPGYPLVTVTSDGSGGLTPTLHEELTGFHHAGALGDVDNDGDLDAFVAGLPWMQQPHYMLRNDGAGQFTDVSQEFLRGDWSDNIWTSELFDLDGDGYLDLAVGGAQGESPVAIHWGDGISFGVGAARYDIQGFNDYEAYDFDAEDLDGDGDRDLLVNYVRSVEPFEYKLLLLRNDGNREFVDISDTAFPVNGEDGYWPDFLHVQDYDDDGDLDILLNSNGLVAWRNDGGVFTHYEVAGPEVIPNPDAHQNTSYSRAENDYIWASRDAYGVGDGWVSAVAFGDFDDDGKQDVLSGMERPSADGAQATALMNFWGDVFGSTAHDTSIFDGGSPSTRAVAEILVGDLNGDQVDDAVVIDKGPDWSTGWPLHMLLSDGAGRLGTSTDPTLEGMHQAGALGDVDNDGDLDLFLGGNWWQGHPNLLLYNDGSGVFSRGQGLSGTWLFSPTAAEFVDLDGDGILDLVLGSSDTDTGVHWGTSPLLYGSESFHVTGPQGAQLSDIDAIDLDGDNDRDLFLTWTAGDWQSHSFQLLRNDGSRILTDVTSTAFPTNGGSGAMSDITLRNNDSDQDADLIYDRWGALHWWRNDNLVFTQQQ